MCAPHSSDRLANDMNWPQSSHQNERRHINPDQKNKRADFAKGIAEQTMLPTGKAIADPAARSLDVESRMPAAQMIRLQMEETGTRSDKKNDPCDSPGHPQARVQQFRRAEAEKNRR